MARRRAVPAPQSSYRAIYLGRKSARCRCRLTELSRWLTSRERIDDDFQNNEACISRCIKDTTILSFPKFEDPLRQWWCWDYLYIFLSTPVNDNPLVKSNVSVHCRHGEGKRKKGKKKVGDSYHRRRRWQDEGGNPSVICFDGESIYCIIGNGWQEIH